MHFRKQQCIGISLEEIRMFVIRPAQMTEYENVREFYHSLINAMKGAQYNPGWEIDIYPSQDFLRESIESQTLYIGKWDTEIASCMVLNRKCNKSYRAITWPSRLDQSECMVIHALGVHPDFTGRGLAKRMVQKAAAVARENGMKAIRLDVLAGNLPAEKLYEGQGFKKVQTVPMYYEDTGWTDYEGYEKIL